MNAGLDLRNAATMRAAQSEWDNRAPADAPSYGVQEIELSIAWAEEAIGRAERALAAGDRCAAVALLAEAGRNLASEMEGLS